jgi:hypothetical protein
MGEQHILGPRLFALGAGDVLDLRSVGETVLFEKRQIRSEGRRLAAVENDGKMILIAVSNIISSYGGWV